MGKELLLEIGTEEIPAAFLPKAIKDMEAIN
jgi:glycyl-tRNA synthetase beta chain